MKTARKLSSVSWPSVVVNAPTRTTTVGKIRNSPRYAWNGTRAT